MNEDLEKYRDYLIEAERQTQRDYDKTVVALSGGALGLSFVFIRDVIGQTIGYPVFWSVHG
jgi:hypothetical protein